jgi:lysophospholipase L1-like esterase
MIMRSSTFTLFAALWLFWTPAGFAQVANPDPTRFQADIDRFVQWDAKNAFPGDGILFAGSSSMVLWPSARYFPELPVINRGFGGSQLSDLLHYLDETALKYEPKMILLYEGDNDVAHGKGAAQIVADFETFVARVHERLPETHIAFVPIKPSIMRWDMWPTMRETNARIRALTQTDERLHYIDVASPMLDGDRPPSASLFVSDGLHLSSEGYDLWSDVVRTFFEAQGLLP